MCFPHQVEWAEQLLFYQWTRDEIGNQSMTPGRGHGREARQNRGNDPK